MNSRLLGIDHGDSRIGLAISDELGSFAHPYRTLQSGARLLEEIRAIVEREKISGIVIGLPKNMDGTLASAAKTKLFGRQLLKSSHDEDPVLGRTADHS
jgi:putative Holliday junction resolvase